MKRVPIVSTLVVVVAMATMVALGLWQLLDRLPRKEAFIAQVGANPQRPPVPFPARPDDRLLFRATSAVCHPPVAIRRAGAGAAGYRFIATCAGGLKVQLGTSRDPRASVTWAGGPVAGWISHAPDARPLIQSLFDGRPQDMLLVAATPLPGLAANTRPDPGLIPNSHLAYAGQWFFFAAVAGIIYVLALRRRVDRKPRDAASGVRG